MTTTPDDRRERVASEITHQIDGVLDVLLETSAVNDDADEGPMLLALLARIREINIVAMRLRDENDHNIDDMERIVFGRVKGPREPEPAEPA